MLSKVKSKVDPAETKPKVLEFFTQNIYDRGVNIFFRSYLFESLRIILDRHTKDFFRTARAVLLDKASSIIASEREANAVGMIEASIDRAND